jgi:small subunit ribosomal protein S7
VVSKSKTLSKVEFFKDKTSVQPLEIFNYIISAVKPSVIVKSRRVGGSTYQVPHVMEGDPVREKRAVSYAIRWIAGAIKSKSGAELSKKILSEFEDILNGRGSSLKKKEDQFKLAEANRPFAHFDNQNHSRRY